jgi:xanthine/uracil permease
MLPSALLLLLLSFSPILIGVIASVPSVVIGTIMIYILAAQIAAGLVLAFESIQEFNFQDGLIIGLPLMLGTIIAFLPAEMLHNIPKIIRPVLGNGFVVGILSALAMEHVTHRK